MQFRYKIKMSTYICSKKASVRDPNSKYHCLERYSKNYKNSK